MKSQNLKSSINSTVSRRDFLSRVSVAGLAISIPLSPSIWSNKLESVIKLGMITDLHHDIMHDGFERMAAFVNAMRAFQPDGVVQMGDFAVPKPENTPLVALFQKCSGEHFHVLGNHDIDGGYTYEQCVSQWKMPYRFYKKSIKGLDILVLDGNDKGSPDYGGGYPSYIGEDQFQWLSEQLENTEGPVLILSHQPLAGTIAVDNAKQLQSLLARYQDKIIAAICGHSHTNQMFHHRDVAYIHLNSASYYWVGDQYRHNSFSKQVHDEYPWISRTCPYKDALFAQLTIDPQAGKMSLIGRSSAWVGPSPKELGVDFQPFDAIQPQISHRFLELSDKTH
ncbi:MAG: metallophosphoesterase [Cyclobacterium sp.]|uniref:metallophosphoesterase family protein n=1 Tax=Cyclobacterium sp. TaxID=1966343 RepID=UPI00397077A7